MIPQNDNKILSSTVLWLENTITKRGQAFSTTSSQFYPTNSLFNNLYTYSAPFQPLVSDLSISGVSILTGVYLNNTFISTGISGLVDINYEQAQIYFNSPISNTITGSYSVNDFSYKFTNNPESTLLFETKYTLKPKVGQSVTGLDPSITTYPVIYVINDGGTNKPFAFGGTDQTYTNIRFVIISDSQFKLDAVSSILKDRIRTFIPLIQPADMPFNIYGGYSHGVYDYFALSSGRNLDLFIDDIYVGKYNQRAKTDIQALNPDVFMGYIDMTVCQVRNPRAS